MYTSTYRWLYTRLDRTFTGPSQAKLLYITRPKGGWSRCWVRLRFRMVPLGHAPFSGGFQWFREVGAIVLVVEPASIFTPPALMTWKGDRRISHPLPSLEFPHRRLLLPYQRVLKIFLSVRLKMTKK